MLAMAAKGKSKGKGKGKEENKETDTTGNREAELTEKTQLKRLRKIRTDDVLKGTDAEPTGAVGTKRKGSKDELEVPEKKQRGREKQPAFEEPAEPEEPNQDGVKQDEVEDPVPARKSALKAGCWVCLQKLYGILAMIIL